MKIVADTNIPFLKGVLEPYAEVTYMDGRNIDRAEFLVLHRHRADNHIGGVTDMERD